MNKLKGSQCFVFLHPTDDLRAWNGDADFVSLNNGENNSWWATRDLQEFGDKQIELTFQGLVYRPALMELVPEKIADKWALKVSLRIVKLNLNDEEELNYD